MIFSNFRVLVATALLLASVHAQDGRCPSELCFCNEQTAKFVCSIELLQGRCEVGRCTKADCGGQGYKCKTAITPGPGILPPAVIEQIREDIEKQGGCKGNVCFAIDGSGSITSSGFETERQFVTDVVRIISSFPTRVAGTQYNTRSNPIKALSPDLNGFADTLKKTRYLGGGTSIASGIDYCRAQVNTRPFEPKKVVVLGDGLQNSGDAIKSARRVQADKGVVSIVQIGQRVNTKLLLDIVKGEKQLAFTAENFTDKIKLGIIIRELTLAICKA